LKRHTKQYCRISEHKV